MSKQIIGFATEFYTLWDYNTENLYTTDARGNHHHTGVKHNYYYIQNISKDLETVKAKYPGLSIDEGLRGKHRSFDRVDRIEMPAEYFPHGKYRHELITDIAKTDLKYIIWAIDNSGTADKTLALLKKLPEVIAFYEEKEREAKERKGEPVLLTTGKHSIEISTNGRSGFHIPAPEFEAYSGRPYMVAALENDKGFTTYVKIILTDVKKVDGMYPYLMPVINGKAMKTKNKTLALDLEIISTNIGYGQADQVAVLKS
jgi:hypothetical protein